MSLQEYWKKIKPNPDEDSIHFDEKGDVVKFPLIRRIFLVLLIILVGTLGFGLGKLSNLNQNDPIKIDYVDLDNKQFTTSSNSPELRGASNTQVNSSSAVIASSKGVRYYYSWCKNTIGDKNRVSFASAILAEKAGYTLATNCKPR